ncbi:hypothetical protein BWR60_32200 [Inquilinus limosus]|uniref:Uncharacterized protein n=1 Tax=Inquilinus limosus TaxID=171674 RepID=A0A211Z2K2_9PROT|nr:hypothetical protein BWR60_32200 [Inquilinus limosus]
MQVVDGQQLAQRASPVDQPGGPAGRPAQQQAGRVAQAPAAPFPQQGPVGEVAEPAVPRLGIDAANSWSRARRAGQEAAPLAWSQPIRWASRSRASTGTAGSPIARISTVSAAASP